MFFSICKATAKTLFRAKTFWLALAILLIFVCHEIISVTHQSYSYELGQVVDQGHPLFVFSYRLKTARTRLTSSVIPKGFAI